MGSKVEKSKAKEKVHTESKGKSDTQHIHNYDIKCFMCLRAGHITSQCSNKRFMILKDHGEIESKSDKSKADMMPPFKDVEYLIKG